MSNKLTGVIIGHSFGACLDNALIMECPAGCIVPQQQLTPVQLEVDDLYEHIYIEGRSGAKIGSLNQAVDLTGSLRRPNVVMLMVQDRTICCHWWTICADGSGWPLGTCADVPGLFCAGDCDCRSWQCAHVNRWAALRLVAAGHFRAMLIVSCSKHCLWC